MLATPTALRLTGCDIARVWPPLACPTLSRPRPGHRRCPNCYGRGWTIRLLPVNGYFTDQFRSAIAAALLLPGHPTRWQRPANMPVHGYVPSERLHKIPHDLATDGHAHGVHHDCLLADYLDDHGSPIDYDRRRAEVDPGAVLTAQDWQRLSDRTVVHRGRDRRLRAARRYLYQLLTGADLTLSSCPLAYNNSTDRRIPRLHHVPDYPTTQRAARARRSPPRPTRHR